MVVAATVLLAMGSSDHLKNFSDKVTKGYAWHNYRKKSVIG